MSTENIILYVSTFFTLFISLMDLFLNSYVAAKNRHFHSTCCQFCEVEYSSSGPAKITPENSPREI